MSSELSVLLGPDEDNEFVLKDEIFLEMQEEDMLEALEQAIPEEVTNEQHES